MIDKETHTRAFEYLAHRLADSAVYHNHKENMGHAAFSLYAATYGTAVFSDSYPNKWMRGYRGESMAIVIAGWLFVLLFIKWQLRNRRIAAMRCAAARQLMVKWIATIPAEKDVQPPQQIATQAKSFGVWYSILRGVDCIWPLHQIAFRVDDSRAGIPAALAQLEQELSRKHPTGAIVHERLLIVSGWVIACIVLIKTGGLP